MIKKYLSVAAVSALLIGMAAVVSKTEVYQPVQEEMQTENTIVTPQEKYEEALSGGADLQFWYDDASYDTYFNEMAVNYYAKTGVLVQLNYVDAMDYVGEIYKATMEEGVFPDAYLLSGEELEKAHLYGVAGENRNVDAFAGNIAENAVIASKCHDKIFGYPLSFNVCLLAYNNQ
ncbi:MAG: hypothetical protein IKU69_06070, partial [Roseburia sp.]|nr:hypothetical protein [Roseburia sp.]